MPLDAIVAMPGAVCWLLCYGMILRRARIDRAFGMPLVALAANICWELIFGFIDPDEPPMDLVNKTWFLVDLGLLWQILAYGREEHERLWPKGTFYPLVAGTLVLAFGIVLGVHLEFDDSDGRYTGWGSNLLMSAVFIQMLLTRGSSAGQTVWIALTKMFGTLSFDIAQFIKTPSWPAEGLGPLMMCLYLGSLVLDLVYLALLVRQLRREGKNPWTRW